MCGTIKIVYLTFFELKSSGCLRQSSKDLHSSLEIFRNVIFCKISLYLMTSYVRRKYHFTFLEKRHEKNCHKLCWEKIFRQCHKFIRNVWKSSMKMRWHHGAIRCNCDTSQDTKIRPSNMFFTWLEKKNIEHRSTTG